MSNNITQSHSSLDFSDMGEVLNTTLKSTSIESLSQTDIDNIAILKNGLTVYNTTTKRINVYNGSEWTDGSVMTELDAVLLTNVYTTVGVSPTYSVLVPGVTSYDDISDKQIMFRFANVPTYGTTITLNINGLGAKVVSNYNLSNTNRIVRLPGQVITLVYNTTNDLFTQKDSGTANPVDAGVQTITILGAKTFNEQVESATFNGFGITANSGYIYTKQTSRAKDTVGDIRMYSWDGIIYTQQCTVANATKGAGTWVAVSNTSMSTTYRKGVVGVATYTGTSMTISTLNTPVVYNTPVTGTLVGADTDTEVTLDILAKAEAGGVTYRESPLYTKQGNLHEILITVTHGLTGSATGVVEYEVISVASNAKVSQGSIVLTAQDTTVQHNISFHTISDANSITSGYRITFKTTTQVTIVQDRVRLVAVAK